MFKRLSKKNSVSEGEEKPLGLKGSCAFFTILRTQFWSEIQNYAEHFAICYM